MNLYVDALKALFEIVVLRNNKGTVIKKICERHGIVYVKFAQILATQNYGNLFTESDRVCLQSICDDCTAISFDNILEILNREYGNNLNNYFSYIDSNPIGSASVSQVHRAKLITGQDVVLKVKRPDVAKNIDFEVTRLSNLVNKYGKLFKFNNFSASNQALELYLYWIKEEIDFENEISNIKKYSSYIESLYSKSNSRIKITLPKLYENISTSNVIVMEFIESATLNKMSLSEENCSLINNAINNYLKHSLKSILYDDIFLLHGDPHSGNIYINEFGDIGFLDMGLVFSLDKIEVEELKAFFLVAYSKNHDKLFDKLSIYGNFKDKELSSFYNDNKNFCLKAKYKDITCFVTDMINLCLKYDVKPPEFLFKVAKSFVCLNGINNFTGNNINTIELLQPILTEFLINKNVSNLKSVVSELCKTDFLEFLNDYNNNGLINAFVKVISDKDIDIVIKRLVSDLGDDINILKDYYLNSYNDQSSSNTTRSRF